MKKTLLALGFSFAVSFFPSISKGQGLVKDLCDGVASSYPSNITNVNGTIFFVTHCGNPQLWMSDGTGTGTTLVKTFDKTSAGLFGLTNVNGTLFFGAESIANGRELWKSDGTDAGTTLVKDINPGSSHALTSASFLGAVLNDKIYFSANNGTETEIWVSDGTDAGTKMLKDVNASSAGASSFCNKFTTINKEIYFVGDDGVHGYELWKTDGTTEGTLLVKDINTNKYASAFDFTSAVDRWTAIVSIDGVMYFGAADDALSNSYKLWKSDGTDAGTVKIAASPLRPVNITTVDKNIFFNTSSTMADLWKSNGTEAGTVVIKKSLLINSTGSANGLFFFYGQEYNKNAEGNELWKSDGTLDGTALVKDINPGTNSSTIDVLVSCNNKIYFAAKNTTSGIELWGSDGTSDGTAIAAETNPGNADGSESSLTDINGTLYFSASDANHGQELWKLAAVTGTLQPENNRTALYPNPATNFVNLSNFDNEKNPMLGVSIYNLTGLKVKELTAQQSNSGQLDVSDLPSGQYVVKLNFTNQTVVSKIGVIK